MFLFYELAKHPEQAEKLYAELKTVDVHDCSAVLPLPHLGALINETLRFHHVIPTGGYRDTPQEGLTIGGQYIPKDTTVIAPRYILNRRKHLDSLTSMRLTSSSRIAMLSFE